MDDYLCIAVGVKAVTTQLEFFLQLGKVIYLTVKNCPDSLVFIVDRLASAREIDDAEPPHAQPDTTLRIKAFIIWPAMDNCPAHMLELGCFNFLPFAPNQACYSAHEGTSAMRSKV